MVLAATLAGPSPAYAIQPVPERFIALADGIPQMDELNSSIEVLRRDESLIEIKDNRTGLHIVLEAEDEPLLIDGKLTETVLAKLRAIGFLGETTPQEALALQLPLRKALRGQLRDQRLLDYLRFLQEQVPFYRSSSNYDFRRIESLADLPLLPTLRKPQVREFYDDLLAGNADIPGGLASGKYALARTSGTTSERLQIVSDLQLDHVPPQFQEVWNLQLGERVPRTAILTSPVCSATECHLGRTSMQERTKFGIVLHLNSSEDLFASPDALVRNISDELEQFRPDFMLANPVYLLWFGRAAQRLNLPLPRFSLILNSYQYITMRQRRLMTELFQAPVYDTYTATELCGCMLGVECAKGRLHGFEDHALVEVDDKDLGTAHGIGRLVVTTIANKVMPLLRYDLGDLGRLLDEECGCPLSDWQVLELHGRARDALTFQGSLFTTRQIDEVVSTVAGFDFYTCRQVSQSAVALDVIVSPGEDVSDTELRNRFQAAFPVKSVTINRVKALRPERSLKFPVTTRGVP